MSFGRDWWVKTLPLIVQGYGGYASVRVRTYSGGDWLVKDVIETHEGTVTLNVWTDSHGHSPIIASSSDEFDFDVVPPSNFMGLTLDFNDIAHVIVIPATVLDSAILQ